VQTLGIRWRRLLRRDPRWQEFKWSLKACCTTLPCPPVCGRQRNFPVLPCKPFSLHVCSTYAEVAGLEPLCWAVSGLRHLYFDRSGFLCTAK
jgi:hypothetical protein